MEVLTDRTKFWQGKRVLVTGHTGFKGSWLCLLLQRLGAEVAGFSNGVPTTPSLFESADVASDMESTMSDIANYDGVVAAVTRYRPEIVFHLAAQSLVRLSYGQPVRTFETNVLGTVNLLESLRLANSTRVVVCVTSDKCYRNKEWDWAYREIDELGGHDPYSASKACAELVAAAYRSSFFGRADAAVPPVVLASARAGNVVGGGDWAPDRLIPDAARAIRSRQELVLRSPEAVRPWQHVLECLNGYLLLGERLWVDANLPRAWNFGPGQSEVRTVQWVVARLEELWAGALKWRHEPSPRTLHESQTLALDSSQARARLGWAPFLGISQALEWTVDWYRGFAAGDDMRSLTMHQLETYLSRCEAASAATG